MRLKNYLKKLSLFSFNEQTQIFLFSLCTFVLDKLNKNIVQTYLTLGEMQRKKMVIEKKSDLISVITEVNDTHVNVLLKRNSSDAAVFKQLIMENEYGDLIRIFQDYNLTIETMIDAGANIGLASIYFKAFYPELNIIALEPTADTYYRLSQNYDINKLKNTKAFQQGLWKENTFLQLDKSFRDKNEWSFRLIENKDSGLNTIKVKSMRTLLEENQWKQVDFLKIDIEGGEVDIFNSQDAVKDWLSKVKILAIEIHDEFNSRENIYALLKKNDFMLQESSSLTIAINSNLVKSPMTHIA